MALIESVRVIGINPGPQNFTTNPTTGLATGQSTTANVRFLIASSQATFEVTLDTADAAGYAFGAEYTMTLAPVAVTAST